MSRSRRWSDPIRRRWYAHHRAIRFARRMRTVATLRTEPDDGRLNTRAEF